MVYVVAATYSWQFAGPELVALPPGTGRAQSDGRHYSSITVTCQSVQV